MRRDELEIGGLYVGSDDQCYRVVDLSPGWRMTADGDWAPDDHVRTRYMPGKGEMPYRANLAIKVLLIESEGGIQMERRAVMDPRKLLGPWETFLEQQQAASNQRQHAEGVARSARRALRNRSGDNPSPAQSYQASEDGTTITLPTRDLEMLVGGGPKSPRGTTELVWSSP